MKSQKPKKKTVAMCDGGVGKGVPRKKRELRGTVGK